MVKEAGERVMIMLGTQLRVERGLPLTYGEHKNKDKLNHVRAGEYKGEWIGIEFGEHAQWNPDGLDENSVPKQSEHR